MACLSDDTTAPLSSRASARVGQICSDQVGFARLLPSDVPLAGVLYTIMTDSKPTQTKSVPPAPTLAAKVAGRLYVTATTHKLRPVRLLCMAIVFAILWSRCLKLYRRELVGAAVGLAAASWWAGVWAWLAALVAVLLKLCWDASLLASHVAGHRAGAEGYTGAHMENSIEALEHLLSLDLGPSGPLKDMEYVEIDVQETADGEVVVFHDFHVRNAFPVTGVNQEPWQVLQKQGLDPATATIQDLTWQQLQTLHLGAQQGTHVPTFEAFIAACCKNGLRWCFVVEVKRLITDKGRQRFMDLLRSYLPYAQQLEQRYQQQQQAKVQAATPLVYPHPQLGLFSVIAFPPYYTSSFGQLGSPAERRWTQQMVDMGIEPRCCFVWDLRYSHDLRRSSSQVKAC